MLKHNWVEMRYTSVTVESEGDDSIRIIASGSAIEIANEQAQFGCWHCNEPLVPGVQDDECPASDNGRSDQIRGIAP